MKKQSRFTKIDKSGNHGVVVQGENCYTFEIDGSYKLASPSMLPLATRNAWENQPYQIGGYKIIPNGATNQLPHELRDTLEENNLTEGVFARQRGLLWGDGPNLYTEVWENNQKVRKWIEDTEIEDWLKSFDYIKYLQKAIVDYNHMEGHFAKFTLNRGSLIGRSQSIAKVEWVGYHRSRLEWPEDGLNPKNIVVGDWYNPNLLGLRSYPVFDAANPFRYPFSMTFCNMQSFARDFYGLPKFWGTLAWIRRGNAIPRILESLTKNSLNIKYHIKSPARYWQSVAEKLMLNCTNEGKLYTEKVLEDYKKTFFEKLTEVLAGGDNVGKFWTSETIIVDDKVKEEFEIVPIEMKVKDFIDSQLLIAKQSDSAIVSGLGLHPSLANIMVEGKLASGSELLYALKLHLATETAIPELIVCEALNMAIAANWPSKKVKIGFYHAVVKTEDAVPPKDRTKNVV